MMRPIGSCTWVFGDLPLSGTAKKLSDLGYQGVELATELGVTNPKEAKTILSDNGLEIFSLTPGDVDVSHPDEAIRKEGLDYFKRLIDFACELDQPIISYHGMVTRIRPESTQEHEDALLIDATSQICDWAAEHDLTVVFEILNRYEAHQVNTVAQGLELMKQVNADNLRLLPDAYHMNIEEADPAAALRLGGDSIGLYHAADSNRGGIGDGHTDFAGQIAALDDIGYAGPIILEVSAPGPDPFTCDKGHGYRDVIEAQLGRSLKNLRAMGT